MALTWGGRWAEGKEPDVYCSAHMAWIDRLPHQPPMRLVEEVVDVTPGDSAVGRRTVRPDDFFLDGHFPGQPIVPAIILVELLAQIGGLAAGSAVEAQGALQFRVAAIGPFNSLFRSLPEQRWRRARASAGTWAACTRLKGKFEPTGASPPSEA